MYCKKKNKKKNKNKNKNNNNNNKKKHKNATKRCVTSCGMKRTSYCALHLRACAEYMTNTNAHTTIHNPYGIAGARSSTISKKLACSLCRIGVIISYEDVSLIYFDVDIANCLNDLQYFVCFFLCTIIYIGGESWLWTVHMHYIWYMAKSKLYIWGCLKYPIIYS